MKCMLNVSKCPKTSFTAFFENPESNQVHTLLASLKIMIQLCEVRVKAWVTGEYTGNSTSGSQKLSTTSSKDIHFHSFTPVYFKEYAPLNHDICLSKYLFWMSNTITPTFLFLNLLYKYMCLEKLTIHSPNPFNFGNVMLTCSYVLFQSRPQISSQNRWLWKSNYSETSGREYSYSISIFSVADTFYALEMQTKKTKNPTSLEEL